FSCNFTLKRIAPEGFLDSNFPSVEGRGLIRAMASQPDQGLVVTDGYRIWRYFGDDLTPLIQFEAQQLDQYTYSADFGVNENAKYVTIPLQRLGDSSSSASVRLATTDLNALAGVNYVATNLNVTFAPLEVTKNINIPILSDGQIRNDLRFGLRLTSP